MNIWGSLRPVCDSTRSDADTGESRVSLITRILELSPYIEVLARRVYWSNRWFIAGAKKMGFMRPRASASATQETWRKIEAFLGAAGVREGSLMIVHSSGTALMSTGYSPARLVDNLLALVGPSQGIDRIRADVSDLEPVYDVQNSVPWTGVLPLQLMGHPGAVRSRHPLNSMAAVGPLARPMMENNMMGDRPLPCGVQSSWKFCADHGAVIVALGVDMVHSATMIHVAEDSYEHEWPIRDWYRERKFRIVDHGATSRVTVRERHPKWAAYYAERTIARDLKRAGLMACASIDGISIELVAAQDLLRLLGAGRAKAYPYFTIPRSLKKIR